MVARYKMTSSSDKMTSSFTAMYLSWNRIHDTPVPEFDEFEEFEEFEGKLVLWLAPCRLWPCGSRYIGSAKQSQEYHQCEAIYTTVVFGPTLISATTHTRTQNAKPITCTKNFVMSDVRSRWSPLNTLPGCVLGVRGLHRRGHLCIPLLHCENDGLRREWEISTVAPRVASSRFGGRGCVLQG